VDNPRDQWDYGNGFDVELFPEAKKHSVGDKSYFWMGTISGVVVMSLTELYLS